MRDPHQQGGGVKDLLVLRGLIDDAPLLAEAIVDTVQDCIFLLDPELKVILANRSVYTVFKVEPEDTLQRMVYDLGNGQWDIPELRRLLEDVLPKNHSLSGYEVTHIFPNIGRKVMRLNARKLRRRPDQPDLILLAIEDITAQQDREIELQRLAREKEVLVREVHHRVKNNLQTIANLLQFHSRHSEEPQVIEALAEAELRVQAVARLHERLYVSADFGEVNMGEYLRTLTTTLQRIHNRPEITVNIDVADLVIDMDRATALALIANELILNCLKHGFPSGRAGHVRLSLRYIHDSVSVGKLLDDGLAQLEVQDNGGGFGSEVDVEKATSSGFELVRLLSRQLRAERKCVVGDGVTWTITFPVT